MEMNVYGGQITESRREMRETRDNGTERIGEVRSRHESSSFPVYVKF